MSPLLLTLYRVLACAYILLFAWPGSTPAGYLMWAVHQWLCLTGSIMLLYALMRIEPTTSP